MDKVLDVIRCVCRIKNIHAHIDVKAENNTVFRENPCVFNSYKQSFFLAAAIVEQKTSAHEIENHDILRVGAIKRKPANMLPEKLLERRC